MSGKIASDMKVYMKQKCTIELLHKEKIANIDIHYCLINI